MSIFRQKYHKDLKKCKKFSKHHSTKKKTSLVLEWFDVACRIHLKGPDYGSDPAGALHMSYSWNVVIK